MPAEWTNRYRIESHAFLRESVAFLLFKKVMSSRKGEKLSGIMMSIKDGRVLMSAIRKKRKAFVAQEDCVACGCCVKVCPLGAIRIVKGIMAQVNMDQCVGCGKCAKECPASVIEIREVEA